ncbi:MAG: FtsX-like permease family protein [Thermoanaerobaculia bacterium]|nr:FtsX-like permease family protein [Thermoanaerobaculia bacterium]
MTTRFFLHHLWRETRGSWRRFAFFLACLAVGVAAVVAVAGLGTEVRRIIRTEARQLLAADLALSGRQPPPPELDVFLAEHPDWERTSIRELVGTSAAPPRDGRPGPSQLVELKMVDGIYPFYGRLALEPERELDELLSPHRVVVAPDLLGRLGLAVGDEILIGGESFTVAGTVDAEPDRMDGLFTLGPRVFLSAAGLERTGLVQYGSRVSYRELLRLPETMSPGEIQTAAEALEAALPVAGLYQIESYVDAQPALRRGLGRVERFLGLVALLSLLIGGVGVAQTVRSWLASRIDAIATLRCIGVRPDEVVMLYLGHTLALGVVGSLVGIALGLGIQSVIPRFLADLLPGELERVWHTGAVLRGLALGSAVATVSGSGRAAYSHRRPSLPGRSLRVSGPSGSPDTRYRWDPYRFSLRVAVPGTTHRSMARTRPSSSDTSGE